MQQEAQYSITLKPLASFSPCTRGEAPGVRSQVEQLVETELHIVSLYYRMSIARSTNPACATVKYRSVRPMIRLRSEY